MEIRTAVYAVSRYELMYVSVREYLRFFWWFVAITPLFGIVALIFGSGPLQVFGMLAILWPFSIPARSVVTTSKSSRLFSHGVHLLADDDTLAFLGEPREGKKPLKFVVSLNEIRGFGILGDVLVLRTRLLGTIPVKLAAFQSKKDVEQFEQLIHNAIDRRLGPEE